jgi:hypothetical protein
MGNTTWLTNGSNTFEVPLGSPLEKRLLAQGYEPVAPEGDKEPESETVAPEAVSTTTARTKAK